MRLNSENSLELASIVFHVRGKSWQEIGSIPATPEEAAEIKRKFQDYKIWKEHEKEGGKGLLSKIFSKRRVFTTEEIEAAKRGMQDHLDRNVHKIPRPEI